MRSPESYDSAGNTIVQFLANASRAYLKAKAEKPAEEYCLIHYHLKDLVTCLHVQEAQAGNTGAN